MATTQAMMSESDIRTHAEALFREWNAHDVDAIVEHLAEDVVWIEPVLSPVRGEDDVADVLEANFRAFPDLHLPLEDFHVFTSVDPPLYVATWTATATMTGSSRGLPATGRTARFSGVTVAHFRDGLISEYRNTYDALDLLQQLGVMPKAEGLGFKAVTLATFMTSWGGKLLHR